MSIIKIQVSIIIIFHHSLQFCPRSSITTSSARTRRRKKTTRSNNKTIINITTTTTEKKTKKIFFFFFSIAHNKKAFSSSVVPTSHHTTGFLFVLGTIRNHRFRSRWHAKANGVSIRVLFTLQTVTHLKLVQHNLSTTVLSFDGETEERERYEDIYFIVYLPKSYSPIFYIVRLPFDTVLIC